MRLPATSAALTFLMDPDRQYVQFNQFAYPALQALSVYNRAVDKPIIQSNGANQPTWSQNQLQGTYSWRNNPSTLVPGTPGIHGFGFAGAQFFEYDALASVYAGAETPVTIVCEVACSSSGGTICGFGDAGTDVLELVYGGGLISLTEVNSNGTFSASATMNNSVHVVTAIRANNTLTLRVDGAQVATHAVTAGTEAFTTFAVGALNSGGSVISQFNGSIGKLAVYSGSADIYSVETFMLQDAGIIRGPSQGINSGF